MKWIYVILALVLIAGCAGVKTTPQATPKMDAKTPEAVSSPTEEKSLSIDPRVGTLAPDFEAQSTNGKTVKLSDFKGSWVVLYFFPKAFTPG
ncbi:MAG: redoxin domain-containing protein [Candidatus Poribacteria bacterium]